MEPSGRMMEVYVPIPEVATPNIVPLSSNDTSAVGGSTESTRLTSLLPLVSPILSPIMHAPLLSPGLECLYPGCAQLYARNECAGFSVMRKSRERDGDVHLKCEVEIDLWRELCVE